MKDSQKFNIITLINQSIVIPDSYTSLARTIIAISILFFPKMETFSEVDNLLISLAISLLIKIVLDAVRYYQKNKLAK
jgi:hypothetical protein